MNDFRRWEAEDTIKEGNERLQEIDREQIELAGKHAEDPSDFESVTESDLPDEDKSAWVSLQLEKREVQADIDQAQKTLDEIKSKKDDNPNSPPDNETTNCADPAVLMQAQEDFEEYRRQIDVLAAQCRREFDETRTEPLPPDYQQQDAGTCDLEGLGEDLDKTLDNLSDPMVRAQLERQADAYRMERQAAWDNMSCSKECSLGGGTCTLDKDNNPICVSVWEFYGGDYGAAIDAVVTAEQDPRYPYKPFSLDEAMEAQKAQ